MPGDGLFRSVLTVAIVAGLSNGSGVAAEGQSSAARTVLVTVEFRALQDGTPLFDLRPQEVGLRVDGVDRDLFDRLRAFRLKTARERGVPPYVIFHDTTLRELARIKPKSLDALRHIYGMGARKTDDLGTAVLETIAEWRPGL